MSETNVPAVHRDAAAPFSATSGGATQLSQRYPVNHGLAWTIFDFCAVVICANAALLLGGGRWARAVDAGSHEYSSTTGLSPFLLLGMALSTAALSRISRLHDLRSNKSRLHEYVLILLAIALSALGAEGAAQLGKSPTLTAGFLGYYILLTFCVMSVGRIFWRRQTAVHFERGIAIRNFVVAGADQTGRDVRDYLTSLAYMGYCFKGFVSLDESVELQVPPDQMLGVIADVIPVSKRLFVDEIILSRRPETPILKGMIASARAAEIDLRLIPSISETLRNRDDVHYVGDLPTIVLHQQNKQAVSLFLKRVLDVGGAALGIALTSPVWLAIAIAIKLESPGPIFYSSNRVGFKGRSFPCHKFRTMVRDAEARRSDIEHLNERDGILFKVVKDPRITKTGAFLRKYSLDELPQLWNVVRGDMSMVGPRPPIISEVEQYEIEHFRRLEVNPGITGLWQVEARTESSFDRYIELDRKYVSNWSIGLDCQILMRTVKVVLMGTGS